MTDAKPYHHGDLRSALLTAAEAELQEKGVEAFSLRSVAKRAGVSHAAPAHHFGDTTGLLTALAALGFQEFLATQHAFEARAKKTPRDQLVAAGLGYVGFARARPTLFKLMFGSERTDYGNKVLKTAAEAAIAHLMAQVTLVGGDAAEDATAVWATAHGLADLLIAGRISVIREMEEDDLQKMLTTILQRSLPQAG
jgi:AcrR family transcriptional regulator